MIVSQAQEILVGDRQVEAVYVGRELVWSAFRPHVEVSKETVWLVDETDMQIVEVKSNVEWTVE